MHWFCDQRADERGVARGHSGSSGKGVEGVRGARAGCRSGVRRSGVRVQPASGAEGQPATTLHRHPAAPTAGRVVCRRQSRATFCRAEQPLGLGTGEADRVASRKSRDDRAGTRCDEERFSGRGAAVEILRSQCCLVAVSGDRLQRAHSAEALGLASRLIDGTAKATALLDFPYAGSTGASCSSTELATGDGPQGTGHVPGRRPIITASFLAFPGTASYRRICRALFGSASEKNRPSASRWTSQTYRLCSTTKRRALTANGLRINSHSGYYIPVSSTLRTDWGRARNHALFLWRTATILGSLRGRHCSGCWDFCFQVAEKAQPPSPALSDRAALLVEDIAARSILFSIGSRDDGIFHRAGPELLLPRAGRRVFLPRAEYCLVPHRAGDAFPQRRARRDGPRRDAGMRLDHGFLLLRPPVVEQSHPFCCLLADRSCDIAEIFASQEIIQHTQLIWKSRNVS